MKHGGGKRKGGSYERECAKLLSLWASNHKRQDIFARTSGSGNSATVMRKQGIDLNSYSGDICCVDPVGAVFASHFYFECKHYADLEWEKTFHAANGKIGTFWAKTYMEATSFSKEPLMMVRENRRPDLIITTEIGYSILTFHTRLPLLAILPDLNMFVALRRDMLMLDFRTIRNGLNMRRIASRE